MMIKMRVVVIRDGGGGGVGGGGGGKEMVGGLMPLITLTKCIS